MLSPGSTRARLRGFTLLESIVVLVVLGILASVSVFGFKAVKDRVQRQSSESEISQMARSSLAEFQNTKQWSSAVSAAVLEIKKSSGTVFSLRQDDPSYAGVRHSDAYGVVSWRSTDAEGLGLAVRNPAGDCSYALVQDGQVRTWTNSNSGTSCSGRYALAGPAASAATDPDSVLPGVASGLVVTGGQGQNVLSWTASAGASYYVITRAGVELAVRATTNSYTDSGLSGGVLYAYTVTPVSANKQRGTVLGPVSGLTIADTPTGLSAVPSGSNVAVTWNDATGQFTGYKLYRNGTAIYTGLNTTYTDSGANAAGATHDYTVTSYNATGESAQSSPSVVGVAPSAPTGLTATSGDKQVTLSWVAPAGSVSGYEVYVNGALSDKMGATGLTVSQLRNGESYTFAVLAYNRVGKSALTSTVSSTPAVIIGAPTSFAASTSNATVALSWAAPVAETAANPLGGYNIYQNGVKITTVFVPARTYSVTGLTNDVTYTFAIEAFYRSTISPQATISATPSIPPPAPTGVSASLATVKSTINVVFAAVPAGGYTVSQYRATCTPTGGGTAVTSGNTLFSPIAVTGGTLGTAYTCTVAARGVTVWGPESAASGSVTPIATPGAPTIVSATAAAASAAVSWTAPASNGGSTITSYTVTSSPGSLTCAAAASPCTVSGLTNGTAYTFTVTATNAAGTGSASTASGSVTPIATPGAPTIVSATAGAASAAVSWTAPASNGGSAITSYKATASPGGLFCTSAASPCTVSGLTNGTAYTFTVTATNAAGTGSASAASGSVTPRTTPGAPTISTVSRGFTVSGSVSHASIAFTAGSTNGAAITNNTVSCTSSTGGVATSGSGAVSPISVTGFTQRATYTCTMTSTNSAGASAASAATAAFMAWGVPAAPASVSIAEASSQSKTLYISVVGANSGGQNLTSMTASCTSSNGGPALSYTWSASLGASPDGSYNNQTYTWPTQYAGKQYTCSATATNPAGTSAATGSNAVTLYGYPTPYGTPYGAVYGAVYGGVYAGPYGYPGPYPGQYGGPYPGQYGGPYGGPSTR